MALILSNQHSPQSVFRLLGSYVAMANDYLLRYVGDGGTRCGFFQSEKGSENEG